MNVGTENVFRSLRKAETDGVDWMSSGSVFRNIEAATGIMCIPGYQAEDLYCMCLGSRPSWYWNLDTVERRLVEAARIPHDMPTTHSWCKMEWLRYQQCCSWHHKSPEYPHHRSNSSSFHLWTHPLPAWLHMALKLAVNTRSGDTTSWLEPSCQQATDYLDKRDCAGHRTHCCRCVGCCWWLANLQGAMTHSRLCTAVS